MVPAREGSTPIEPRCSDVKYLQTPSAQQSPRHPHRWRTVNYHNGSPLGYHLKVTLLLTGPLKGELHMRPKRFGRIALPHDHARATERRASVAAVACTTEASSVLFTDRGTFNASVGEFQFFSDSPFTFVHPVVTLPVTTLA